ncbi:MAG: hypothetical protein ACR2GY_12165 [Phycisphaerales bacterium]
MQTPIARFNLVPWQELHAGSAVGVVAFHRNGIERVQFRLHEWSCDVILPTYNPASRTVEYWCTLPAAAKNDGAIIAVIHPRCGSSRDVRVLSSDLSQPPDHLRIVRNEVITGKLQPRKGERFLWLDSCTLKGGDHWRGGWWERIFTTDCVGDGSGSEGRFFLECELARHCSVHNFASDAFRDCAMVIGGECTNQIASGVDHADCVQLLQPLDDVIIYGLSAIDRIAEQGLFCRGADVVRNNVAIVDNRFHLSGYPSQNQWMDRVHHMVMTHNEFRGAPLTIKMGDSKASGFAGSTDVLIERNLFQWLSVIDARSSVVDVAALAPDVCIDDNAFLNAWPANVARERQGRPIGRLLGTRAVQLDA